MYRENPIYEDPIVELEKLVEKKNAKPGEEKESEEGPERGDRKLEIAESVRDLGKHDRDSVVKAFRRLKRRECSFKFAKSGAQRYFWIGKPLEGRESRKSVPAPEGIEKLLWKAGIRPGRA